MKRSAQILSLQNCCFINLAKSVRTVISRHTRVDLDTTSLASSNWDIHANQKSRVVVVKSFIKKEHLAVRRLRQSTKLCFWYCKWRICMYVPVHVCSQGIIIISFPQKRTGQQKGLTKLSLPNLPFSRTHSW